MGGKDQIHVEPLGCPDMLHLEKVKQLGIKNTRTLGLFPPAAFDDYARRGRILVALTPDADCVGYVLFSTTRDRATIFHLCIDDRYQGKGIARKLVDALGERTKHLRGISLKCRRDYAANDIWPRLGFQALTLAPGKSKEGLPVITWWRSHGGIDLFSESRRQFAEIKVPVVMDANIIIDFQEETRTTDSTSLALRAPWLSESIELCVTPEAANELTRRTNADEAGKSVKFVRRFHCVESDQPTFQRICAELKPGFGTIHSNQDESDFRQIAWAIASGARYFVTRDGRLCDRAEVIEEKFNLRILQPAELIVEIDELRRAEAYQPSSLAATDLIVVRVGTGEAETLAGQFQNHRDGETKAELLVKLNKCLAAPDRCDVFVVRERNQPLALYSLSDDPHNHDTLEVPILRAAETAAGSALARHIAQRLVQQHTLAKGRRVTMVRDEKTTDAIRLSLEESGFFELAVGWIKISIPAVATASETANIIKSIHALTIEAEGLKKWADMIAAQPTLEEEHTLWPLKISDLELPAYIVPIQPRWAADLFDEGLAAGRLWGRDTSIGINTEAVYYRSCHGCTLQAPARLLWYVSEGKGQAGTKAIRACSRLDEVVIGKPKNLFKQFSHLGVYQWDDVYIAANCDIGHEIMALRFSGTELFKHPILIRELRHELTAVGANPTMVGPVEISQPLFFKLYEKAVR